MFWIIILFIGTLGITIELLTTKNIVKILIFGGLSLLGTILIVYIDYKNQVSDVEVWSGSVIGWEHEEEWDEWIPPVTTCTTSSNGQQSCTTTPGYWEHHEAENYVETSDKGLVPVSESPDGKRFDDSWPNNTNGLKNYWPLGMPTASTHVYENKVNASYSIYKHKEINIEDYPDLPEYPINVKNQFTIDRILGDVPNKKDALKTLASENTRLNSSGLNKQVNLIFVNLGINKSKDYGFALQDYWEGGNKNDFVVSFSTNEEGKILWSYPFSWSESELLKIEVRDYMNDLDNLNDFDKVIKEVSTMVEKGFVRKEFSDFDYIKIKPSITSYWILILYNIILIITSIVLSIKEKNDSNSDIYSYFGNKFNY